MRSPLPLHSVDRAAVSDPAHRCEGAAARGLLPVLDSVPLVARVVARGVKDVQLRLKDRPDEEVPLIEIPDEESPRLKSREYLALILVASAAGCFW